MDYTPSISVIINTDGRVNSLTTCLESLRYLRYPNFEVIVVAGPTEDGTHELCQAYANEIKFAECPVRNLSISRNISIQISSGEIIAFLDDDSIPEPEWLNDVAPFFQDPDVAVAGGFLHDHTGKAYQWRFGTVDRFGNANHDWERPTPEFNFPFSFVYPHVMANSLFRRSAVVEVGGFDEEYEYFLDESDIIIRFVDAGWKVAQLDKGFVHHKYLPSNIRNDTKVLTSWYSVIKGHTYFPLVNGGGHITIDKALENAQSTIQHYRELNSWAIENGLLEAGQCEKFEDEVDQAVKDGLSRGTSGERKMVDPESLKGVPEFKPFIPKLDGSSQCCFVFISQTYPPGNNIGGIGRYTHHLAREIARIGHQVHVLTRGEDHDRVDFEENVWVHRLCIKDSKPPEDLVIPAHLWSYSNTMLEEAREISIRRNVDCVYAPIWDVEGIAFLTDQTFKLVTSLQTSMQIYLECNPQKHDDTYFMENHAKPLLALEKKVMQECDGIHAISHAIVDKIEQTYGFKLDHSKVSTIPLGLHDWTSLDSESPDAIPEGVIRICFVGRLEPRKGADVFLEIVPELLENYSNTHIDIIGDDTIAEFNGRSIRAIFEENHSEYAHLQRLRFHGAVSDERLRGFYQSADIIVAPSRYESFGLVHLEGLMFGKAVIGCDAGGVTEIIDDRVTGMLARPGDASSLRDCTEELINNNQLRETLGINARAAYMQRFTARVMAEHILESLITCSNR